MCACVCVSSLLFFAFIVHLQPLRRSRHVCVCMCESSGNSFATSYGHDVLEIWCGLIAHCDPDCCFFFVLFLNYNLDITIHLIFLFACTESRCSLYGHMDAAVYVCTCLSVWLCVYALTERWSRNWLWTSWSKDSKWEPWLFHAQWGHSCM